MNTEKEPTMRKTRKCRHALEGCARCLLGFHCRKVCAADAAERKLRKAAARQRARREEETR